MIVRPATQADSDAAATVLRRSITELCGLDHQNDPAELAAWLANKTPQQVASWVSDPRLYCVVAVRDDVCGFGAIRDDGDLLLNYVLPEARYSGVSNALLLAMEMWARGRGLAFCTLETTRTAAAFYRERGYAPDAGDRLRKPL